MQWPETQLAVEGQASPQAPQLVALDDRSTHRLPAQVTRGAGQLALQKPFTQKGEEPLQVLPQAPQLLGSPLESTQLVPHRLVPCGQPPG
jgi:hypothetical protein